MGQFDRQIETAKRLIAKNGQVVEWSKPNASIPDATKPWLPTDVGVTTYSATICFLPLDLQGREFVKTLGITEASSGAFYGLMGEVLFTPAIGDYVTRNGVKLDIASIDLLSPNGQNILYTIIFNG